MVFKLGFSADIVFFPAIIEELASFTWNTTIDITKINQTNIEPRAIREQNRSWRGRRDEDCGGKELSRMMRNRGGMEGKDKKENRVKTLS